jgi:hypothetical protein
MQSLLTFLARRGIRWVLPLVQDELAAERERAQEQKNREEERYLHELHLALLPLSDEEWRAKLIHDPHLLLRYEDFRKRQRV